MPYIGVSWGSGDSPVPGVKFLSRASSPYVTVRVAKQMAQQKVANEIRQLFPRLKDKIAKEYRDKIWKEIQSNPYNQLISNGSNLATKYGSVTIDTNDQAKGSQKITARDYLSREVPEALILSYTGGEREINTYVIPRRLTKDSYRISEQSVLQRLLGERTQLVHDVQYNSDKDEEISTREVFHIDLSPQVSLATNKNLILTQVQGRDFTRKELIANGDLTFSVSGSVASFYPGTYPTEAVKRLIKIAQYKGLVKVHHFIFDQFGVKNIIIKDFNLGQQEFLNIQPYSFTCVAVEADDITLQKDTIGAINKSIASSSINGWQKYGVEESQLVSKLAQMGVEKGVDNMINTMGALLDQVI